MEGERDYFTHLEGGEKRLTNRLMHCWSNAAQGSEVPALGAILAQYVGDLWDYIFVLEVQPGGQFVFQEIGNVFSPELHRDLIGSSAADTPPRTLLFQCTRNLDVFPAKKRPAFFAGEYIDLNGQVSLYRSCLLPVTLSTSESISILGAGWCRTEGSLSRAP